MDFAAEHFERQGYGDYQAIDPKLLPPVYVACGSQLSQGTEVLHNDLRGRFERGDRQVLEAMDEWADLTLRARDLLLAGRGMEIGPLLDRNFDLRREVCPISKGNIRLVETARSTGASAKFTGSGGAIVGVYDGEEMFEALRASLTPLGVEVFKPSILAENES